VSEVQALFTKRKGTNLEVGLLKIGNSANAEGQTGKIALDEKKLEGEGMSNEIPNRTMHGHENEITLTQGSSRLLIAVQVNSIERASRELTASWSPTSKRAEGKEFSRTNEERHGDESLNSKKNCDTAGL